MGITKNVQSCEIINKMLSRAFPENEVFEIKELSGGCCNAVYRITFTDGKSVILKIAPAENCGTLRNEKNMMSVETESMEFMQCYPDVHVAKVLFSDKSRSICSGEYFFMENLDGENLSEIIDKMSDETKSSVNFQIGQVVNRLSHINGEKFGIFGQEQFDTLYEFVYYLFRNFMVDAAEVLEYISLPFSLSQLLQCLERDMDYFKEVGTPSLVHWDLWEGNVFVKDDYISGIIDWERTMWGEQIMCDRFRCHSRNEDFLKGYGQIEFSAAEKRRMAWYDVFLFATMTVEGVFRQYEDDSLSRWVSPFLESAWKEICDNC